MEEENDSKREIEQFIQRIKVKSHIHQGLLEYFGISADDVSQESKKGKKSEEIYKTLKENNIYSNKSEFREFLETISHLWTTHQSNKEMKYKIENLFILLKKEIKNVFSEDEIYFYFRFCYNRSILLTLVEQNILSVETIIKNTNLEEFDDCPIINYFYPEIRKFDEKYINDLITKNKINNLKEFIEENDQNLESFYKIRKEGKKESKIIELIRENKVEEFISFVEHFPINLNERIQEETIFDINPTHLTPIEHSALFGSIEIFKYLYMKDVNLKANAGYDSNIIKCAVQGRNYEIIHLLEERNDIIEELNNQKNQQSYLIESIKMYHNEIFEYFIINYNFQITKEIVYSIIINRNYQLLNNLIERNQIEIKDKAIINYIFSGFCENGNEEIVKILINQPNLDINSKDKILDNFLG